MQPRGEMTRGELDKRAASFREFCGLDDCSPIGDIEDLVKNWIGYDLIREPHDVSFAAFVVADSTYQYRIVFNEKQYFSEAFFRFSIAHELAHTDLHLDILMNYPGRVLHRSKALIGARDDVIEREADQFASSFLIPQKGIKAIIRKDDPTAGLIEKIAEHFKVSTYAASLRHQDVTTDLCNLIVTDCASGLVQFERHSQKWHERYRRPLFQGKPLPENSVTRYYLDNLSTKTEDTDKLSVWLPDAKGAEETETLESTFRVDYCNKLFTLLTILE